MVVHLSVYSVSQYILTIFAHESKRKHNGPAYGPTDRLTDVPSYRDAWTHLKTNWNPMIQLILLPPFHHPSLNCFSPLPRAVQFDLIFYPFFHRPFLIHPPVQISLPRPGYPPGTTTGSMFTTSLRFPDNGIGVCFRVKLLSKTCCRRRRPSN